jgi:hypothetical protein
MSQTVTLRSRYCRMLSFEMASHIGSLSREMTPNMQLLPTTCFTYISKHMPGIYDGDGQTANQQAYVPNCIIFHETMQPYASRFAAGSVRPS